MKTQQQEKLKKSSLEGQLTIFKGVHYHNPDAIARLVGKQNIADVRIDGVPTQGLLDSGSQISSIVKSFAESLGLNIKPLADLGITLDLEGSGGTQVPYLG